MSLPGTFDHLHDALKALQAGQEDMEITSDFLNVLKDDKKEVEREIQETQDAIPEIKARLESRWVDQKVPVYERVSGLISCTEGRRAVRDITGRINPIFRIIVSSLSSYMRTHS
jgi:hypothetical protein